MGALICLLTCSVQGIRAQVAIIHQMNRFGHRVGTSHTTKMTHRQLLTIHVRLGGRNEYEVGRDGRRSYISYPFGTECARGWHMVAAGVKIMAVIVPLLDSIAYMMLAERKVLKFVQRRLA